MLFFDLTISIIIMINALIINQSSGARESFLEKEKPEFGLHFGCENQRHLKRNRRLEFGRRRSWYLNPVLLKLNNVIDKYEFKRPELEALYAGVVVCGLSRCEKFRGLIPKNQHLRHLKICGKGKAFKKMIYKVLSDLHIGVQRIEKSFHILSEYEKWPHLRNGSRKKILEELKTEMKLLNLEVESVMKNKRLKMKSQVENLPLPLLTRPKYQTHLMIYEWRVIVDSKKFLQNWQKNLKKIFRCWKKRKREIDEKSKLCLKSFKILENKK